MNRHILRFHKIVRRIPLRWVSLTIARRIPLRWLSFKKLHVVQMVHPFHPYLVHQSLLYSTISINLNALSLNRVFVKQVCGPRRRRRRLRSAVNLVN